jgi:hypothetical protein
MPAATTVPGAVVSAVASRLTAEEFAIRYAGQSEQMQQIFRRGEVLTLPDVLPGFSVAVDRLFA